MTVNPGNLEDLISEKYADEVEETDNSLYDENLSEEDVELTPEQEKAFTSSDQDYGQGVLFEAPTEES